VGLPAGSKGYVYLDPTGSHGPYAKLVANPALGAILFCSGAKGAIPFSLDEATQGALTVSIKLGSEPTQCLKFSRTVFADAGTANPGPLGLYSARDALQLQDITGPGPQTLLCPEP